MHRLIHSTEAKYNILKELGTGATGTVFLAKKSGENNKIALKLLHKHVKTADELAFKSEFAALHSIHNPHVCRVHDFGQCQESHAYFFTADYIEGDNLYQTAFRDPKHVTSVFLQLLRALGSIHAQGLIHHDVKGANIIVSGTDQHSNATLVDFGFAQHSHRDHDTPSGTLQYMAPEKFCAGTTIDARCDLYALGITMYRWITGAYPSQARNLNELRTWQQHCALDMSALNSAGVPDYIVHIIRKLVQPHPSARYSSARTCIRYLALHTEQARSITTDISSHSTSPFIGQHALLKTLQAAMQDQDELTAQCHYIYGQAQAGKTRILTELKYHAQLQEMRTIAIDCAAPNALSTFDSALALQKVDPHNYTARSDALTERPTCLFLDDIDSAAPTLQRVIKLVLYRCHQAAQQTHRLPLIIIATAHPEASPVTHLCTAQHQLTLFTEEDITALLHELQADPEHLATWRQEVLEYSGGIPGLAIHAARYRIAHQDIPDSPDAPLQERITTLSSGAHLVARILAELPRGLCGQAIHAFAQDDASTWLAELMASECVRYDRESTRFAMNSTALRKHLQHETLNTTQRQAFDALLAQPAHLSIAQRAHIAECCSDPTQAIPLLDDMISSADSAGDTKSAIHYCQRRLAIEERNEYRRRLGRLQLLAGDLTTAEHTLDSIVATTRKDRIDTLSERGWIARLRRNPEQAHVHLQEALALCDASIDQTVHIALRNDIAQCTLECGKAQEAADQFADTHRDAQQLSTAQQREIRNNNLGNALIQLGRYDAAETFFTHKLTTFHNDRRMTLSIFTQRASMRIRADNHRGALRDYQTAWQLMQASGNFHNAHAVINNIITLLQRSARYADALTFAEHGFALLEDSSTTQTSMQLTLTLAQLYTSLHCYDLAHTYYLQLEHDTAVHDANLGTWLHIGRATWHLFQQQYDEAAQQLQRAHAATVEDPYSKAWIQLTMAQCAHDQGKIACAQKALDALTMTNDTPHDVRCHYELLRGQCAHTLEPLKRALHIADHNDWRELSAEAHHAMGIVYEAKQQPDNALTSYRTAANCFESIATELSSAHRDTYLQHASYQHTKQRVRHCMTSEPQAQPTRAAPEGAPAMHKLEQVFQIMKQLASEHDPERLLSRMIDEAIDLSGAERGLLIIPHGDQLCIKIARNIDPAENPPRYSHSIVSQVIQSGKAVMTVDAPGDDEIDLTQSIASLKLQSIACLPLMHTGRLRGIIYLDSQARSHPLTPELTKALEYFAEQAAVALNNAEKIAESTQARLKAEEERAAVTTQLESTQERVDQLRATVHESQAARGTRYAYDNIIGRSKGMQDALHILDKITATKAAVVVCGETGTGKELIAKALHFNNPHRNTKRFVAVNCAALPDTILESELFGYRKGAFTGAERDKPGLFEEAHGGTLFLDEIGDMSLAMQAKILRCLQEQEIRRLGDDTARTVDVRIVAASNKDLQQAVAAGEFRQDLLYRIGGLQITLPPLRERAEDIPLLCKHFVAHAKAEHDLRKTLKLGSDALRALQRHNWPGNIRELEHVITNALLLSESDTVTADQLPIITATGPAPAAGTTPSATSDFNPRKTLKDYEAEIIAHTLEHFGGNKSKTAEALGITRMTLGKKVKIYGIGS